MVLEKQQLIIGNNLLVFFKNFVSAAGKRGKCNVAAENVNSVTLHVLKFSEILEFKWIYYYLW